MSDFLRQLDIINPDHLVYPVTCVGLGGIGSFTAVALRKLGFRKFFLYDGDIVEAHNVPSQNFTPNRVGMPKAAALTEILRECFDDEADINPRPTQLWGDEPLEGVVVSGVDSMSSRKTIRHAEENSRALGPLYIDGRIGIEWSEEEHRVIGEWIEIFSINPSSTDDIEFYESHLFEDEEAAPLHCTAQAVIYTGNIIAGIITSNVKKWICKEKFPRHFLFDVLTLDMLHAIE